MFEKIQQAKCGNTVTICPEELADAQFYELTPLTIADLISMCQSFNLPYVVNDAPPLFTINPPVID